MFKAELLLSIGYINPLLKGAINLTSTLFHEKTHLETEETSQWEHMGVYYKQISHKSWKATSDDLKQLNFLVMLLGQKLLML